MPPSTRRSYAGYGRHQAIVHVLDENIRQRGPDERQALAKLRAGDVVDREHDATLPKVFAGAFDSAVVAVGLWNFVSSRRP
jgi:hypothetical protein